MLRYLLGVIPPWMLQYPQMVSFLLPMTFKMNNICIYSLPLSQPLPLSGMVMYTRGPWSPSGLTSMQLTSTDIWYNQSESLPTFKILVDEHESTRAYVPDTVNKKTASGRVIYSKTLENELAQLDFEVKCWGANSSYIFGFGTQNDYYWDNKLTGEIAVVSSETYQLTAPDHVVLPDEFLADDDTLPEIPRGVNSQADFKRMSYRR